MVSGVESVKVRGLTAVVTKAIGVRTSGMVTVSIKTVSALNMKVSGVTVKNMAKVF